MHVPHHRRRRPQEVIDTVDLEPRLSKVLLMLKKEHALTQLQASIKQDVEKRIDKQQRTYFLMEQLKSIKKELGLEKDDKVRSRARDEGWRAAAESSVRADACCVALHSSTYCLYRLLHYRTCRTLWSPSSKSAWPTSRCPPPPRPSLTRSSRSCRCGL
jgi:hypothetical protein